MSDIVTPFSGLSALDINSTNFPALAHFLRFNEATVAVNNPINLLDSATGAYLHTNATPAVGLTNNADGTVSFIGQNLGVLTQTWTPPGTKKVVAISIGKPAATLNSIIIGDAATNGIRIPASATGTPAIASGGVVVTGTAGLVGTGAQLQGRILVADWGNKLNSYDFDGTTFSADRSNAVLAATGLSAFDNGAQGIANHTDWRPALFQLWYFDTLPNLAEIKAAALWTYAQVASAGYVKAAYPGWSKRT